MKKKQISGDLNMQSLEEAILLCRTCNHMKLLHPFKGGCTDISVKNSGEYNACKCLDFVYKDNLKYIETIYKNKKGKKK